MSVRLAVPMIVAGAVLLAADPLAAQPTDRTSLRGLAGVGIIVEPIGGDAGRFGLNRTALRIDTEIKLKEAGIRALSMEEYLDVPAGPYLHLNVKTIEAGTPGTHAYTINVDLRQDVLSSILPDTILYEATTWASAPILGTIASTELSTLRARVQEVVDLFVADFVAANQDVP